MSSCVRIYLDYLLYGAGSTCIVPAQNHAGLRRGWPEQNKDDAIAICTKRQSLQGLHFQALLRTNSSKDAVLPIKRLEAETKAEQPSEVCIGLYMSIRDLRDSSIHL